VTGVSFVDVPFGARTVSIEHAWIAPSHTAAPLVVFLHEGLGSVAMWKDYPQKLCDEGGYRGLVFSRVGYGRSTPRPRDERWPPDFMDAQAREFLPRFFARLGIGADGAKPWLLGHSDGASIALIHAAACPETVAGVIAVAPHIVVEELAIRSIQAAKHAYVTADLKSRLARYHDDPDSAFGGWSDAWLAPEFRGWSIEAILADLRCPILAVQGEDDEYGTPAQVQGIRQRAPQTTVIVFPNCGHSPHRDQPEALTQAVKDFIVRYSPAPTRQGEMQ